MNKFYVGKNVRENAEFYTHNEKETRGFEQLEQAGAPVDDFNINYPVEEKGKLNKKERKV